MVSGRLQLCCLAFPLSVFVGCIELPKNAPLLDRDGTAPEAPADQGVLTDSDPGPHSPLDMGFDGRQAPSDPLDMSRTTPSDAAFDGARPPVDLDRGASDAALSGDMHPIPPDAEENDSEGFEMNAPCEAEAEVCDGVDNDCDDTIDEGCECLAGDSRPCGRSAGACVRGTAECSDDGRWGPCMDGVSPREESCDGSDNDCDGLTDEGVLNACEACGPVPDEVCNGEDDDCDGNTDEGCECVNGSDRNCGLNVGPCEFGVQACQGGAWGPCEDAVGPTPEGCDGLDNDCDGEVDEGVLNLCGACGAAPQEACDGEEDEDCDGTVDEGCICVNGVTRVCDFNVGVCAEGERLCRNGRWSGCRVGPDVGAEVCDGEDNDCDGETDEGVQNACGGCGPLPQEVCDQMDNDCDGHIDENQLNACGDCGAVPEEACDGEDNDCDGRVDEGVTRPCGSSRGECREGQQSCINVDWGACEGAVGPSDEVCDRLDNDCDGASDEHAQPESVRIVESCDGIDNDCDGRVDEDWPGHRECVRGNLYCDDGSVGLCQPGLAIEG